MRSISVLLCTAALLTACNRDNAAPAEKRARDELAQSPSGFARADAPALAKAQSPAPLAEIQIQSQATHSSSDSVVSSMIIRTGQASVQVDSLERGIRAVRALASHVGGYIANSSIAEGSDQTHSATLEIKIPAPRFDDAINGLQPIGHLESVSVNAEDVGEEFVDVTARAVNGHKLEQRLIDILGTRT